MREGIGSVVLYNIIIVFILIVFALLAATLSYYKAFKVNNRILASIDKYEGYNQSAIEDINNTLAGLGYTTNVDNDRCKSERSDATLVSNQDTSYYYCVYFYRDDRGEADKKKVNGDNEPIYYNYSVVSYIYADLPIVGAFKIPVHTKGERIYNFSDGQTYNE